MNKQLLFLKICLIISATPLFFISALWVLTLGGFDYLECIHSIYMLAVTSVFLMVGIGVAAQAVTEEE